MQKFWVKFFYKWTQGCEFQVFRLFIGNFSQKVAKFDPRAVNCEPKVHICGDLSRKITEKDLKGHKFDSLKPTGGNSSEKVLKTDPKATNLTKTDPRATNLQI